jgi:hypothetical protein
LYKKNNLNFKIICIFTFQKVFTTFSANEINKQTGIRQLISNASAQAGALSFIRVNMKGALLIWIDGKPVIVNSIQIG